jgi:hypothetical protein
LLVFKFRCYPRLAGFGHPQPAGHVAARYIQQDYYCRDIGDSARTAGDEQEHELFAGKRFYRPSFSLFRNSNVVSYALIGEAPMGDPSGPCRSYCAR